MTWVNCTGDAVKGDYVRFERDVFTGSFRRPRYAGTEWIEGRIVAESYGADKQQHTFTIERPNGEKMRIKGRNLYRNGCQRRIWADESERRAVAAEKHARGDIARARREARREFI